MLCRRGLDKEVLAKRLRNVLNANSFRSLSKFDHYWTALSKPQADEKDKVPAVAVQEYREAEAEGKQYFYNRNPRNSELLNFKSREYGWTSDESRVCTDYYNRIVLEKTGKHITARLEHFESGELLTVSTQEPWIKSRLNKTYDRIAALNVGRILAHRMKGLGLNSARFWDPHHSEYLSAKTEAFMCGLKMEGVKLEEEEVTELFWQTAEDGDSAHKYHTDQAELLEYLNRKAEERKKQYE